MEGHYSTGQSPHMAVVPMEEEEEEEEDEVVIMLCQAINIEFRNIMRESMESQKYTGLARRILRRFFDRTHSIHHVNCTTNHTGQSAGITLFIFRDKSLLPRIQIYRTF